MGRFLRGLCKATIFILAVAALAFIGRVVYGYMMDVPLLTLREVVIEGCRNISEKDILFATQLYRRPNILSIELASVRKAVEKNPWVERAEIRRVFPDRISIKITERRPVAFILLDRLYHIDAQGVIFATVPEGHEIDHPILTGLHRDDFETYPDQSRGLISKALGLLKLMEGGETLSHKDISEIHMDKAHGIDVYTNEGAVEIKLGLDRYEAKWKRLERVWGHLRQRSLTPAYINCDYEKRVIVKMREATAYSTKRLVRNS